MKSLTTKNKNARTVGTCPVFFRLLYFIFSLILVRENINLLLFTFKPQTIKTYF